MNFWCIISLEVGEKCNKDTEGVRSVIKLEICD